MIFLGIAIVSAIVASIVVNAVYNVYLQKPEEHYDD